MAVPVVLPEHQTTKVNLAKLSPVQLQALQTCLSKTNAFTRISGSRLAGKSIVAAQVIASVLVTRPLDRIVVFCPTESHLEALFTSVASRGDVDPSSLCILGTRQGRFRFVVGALCLHHALAV